MTWTSVESQPGARERFFLGGGGGGGKNVHMPSDCQNLGGGTGISIPLRQKVGGAIAPPAPAPLISAAFESTRPNTNSHPSQPVPHWSTHTLTNMRGFPGWSLPLAPVLTSAGVDVKLGLGLKGISAEFQVIRGLSQKIPADLLSYDKIHS